MKRYILVTLSVSALALASCAKKDEPTVNNAMPNAAAPVAPEAPPAMSAGQTFANAAAASDASEIESSKLADTNAASTATKAFAQSMIKGHTESTAKLKKAASEATPPLMPNATLAPDQVQAFGNAHGVTPSLTLSWHSLGHGVVWLRYASAARPGGINTDGDPGARSFRSDDLKILELGLRLTLADGHLQLNGSLFGLRWENVQSDTLGMDSLVRTINAGRVRNVGAELSAALHFEPFRLQGNLTVQHRRLYRPSAAANALGDDNRLPVLPDYARGLKLTYARPVGDAMLDGFVSARYTGPARLSFDPSLDRPMGDFSVSDIGVELSRGDWKAGPTVANLLDQREDSFGYGNRFTLRLIDQSTPMQPRTLTLRLQKNF